MIYIFIVVFIFSVVSFQMLSRKLHGNEKYHPIAGTVFQHLMNFNRLHDYMTDVAEKYTTYRLINFFRCEVYTSDPDNVEYMLKTNFDNFAKGDYNYTILKDLFGDGIFCVDGDRWREQRKVSSYEFSTRVLRDFSSVVFMENASTLANVVSKAANFNQPMDIQDLLMKVALDSTFKVSFGVDLDVMCGSNKEGAEFREALDDVNARTMWRYVDILWKLKRAFGFGSEGKLKKNLKVIDEYVYKLISNKTDKMNKLRDDEDTYAQMKKEDILSRFLQLNEANPKYLRDMILNFVIAGKDSTATTLAWFVYMLCKHPLVQEKLAKEIEHATGSNGAMINISDFAAGLSDESMKKMHYLHAALTETLRLYPAVPVDSKICLSDDTMPDGFHVRKGDLVAYQPYAMGRMRSVWGDDAREFKPERWIDENGCFRPENPFKFTAFQAGPRICLGRDFAYRQMKIFSAVLLRFFVFKLSDKNHTAKYRTMMGLHIDGGLSVRAFHRSSDKIST